MFPDKFVLFLVIKEERGGGGGRIKDVGRDALVYVFDSESHLFHILQQHLLQILIAKM